MLLFSPRFTIPLSLFWLVFVLIAFSNAAADYLIVALTVWVFGLWGLSWFVRGMTMLVALFISSQQGAPKPIQPWKLLYLSIEPAAIGLSLALILFNISTSIRLKLSESALTSYVQEIRAGRRSLQHWGEPTRRVGLFEVKETELLDGGTVRLITAEDFLDHAGLVYSPKQQPPVRGEASLWFLVALATQLVESDYPVMIFSLTVFSNTALQLRGAMSSRAEDYALARKLP